MKINRRTRSPLTFVAMAAMAAALLATNVPAQSQPTNYWRPLPKGPHVHAYYEGRSPCREISTVLGATARDECIKIKWQLILFKDPATDAPTTYAIGGFGWRNPPKTGKWAVVKGTKEDPNAVVYQLDPDDARGFLSFQKADENILLFLDRERRLLVGNSRFSYTLNRAERP